MTMPAGTNAASFVARYPVAEGDESVPDPIVIVNSGDKGDLLNQPLVGVRDQAVAFGVVRVLEAISNDPGYKGY